MAKIRGLGKGLASLIPSSAPPIGEEIAQDLPQEEGFDVFAPCDSLFPNPFQPRKQIGRESLASLTASIREHGVIQPVLVRKSGPGYQIVAGERRWEAARAAGLNSIPIRVLELNDAQAMELALVENLQREDLTPLETARGLQELITHLNLTHEDAAQKIGLNRATVTNKLRLLQLPEQVLGMLERGLLTEGHARALLALPDENDRIDGALLSAQKNWNVRQLEEHIRNQAAAAKFDAAIPKKADSSYELPEEIASLCKDHKLTIKIDGGRRGMGLSIRGLKRWQVQLILEHIEKHQEEIFPSE